jgi:hypothetical protein
MTSFVEGLFIVRNVPAGAPEPRTSQAFQPQSW